MQRRLVLLAVAACIVPSACGGSDDDDTGQAEIAGTAMDSAEATSSDESAATSTSDTEAAASPDTAVTEADSGADSGSGSEAEVSGGVLTVGLGASPSSLDPHKTSAGADNLYVFNVFEGLFFADADRQTIPALALSAEASPDALEWTVALREGVTFQNGEPMTADDVKFSFDRFLDPDTGAIAAIARSVAGVDVIDESTVLVRLTQPDSDFLHTWARVSIVPKDYIEENGDEYFAEHPISTGPWQVVDYQPDESMTLERYDGYWGDKPGYSELVFRYMPDDNTRLAALQSGQVDMAVPIALQSADRVGDGLVVESAPSGQSFLFQWNMLAEDAPWQDVRVREAMNLAIDREGIAESVMQGFAVPMNAMMGIDDPRFTATGLSPYPYDPEQARALLEEAGYGDGFSMDLYAPTNGRWGFSEEVTLAVASQLEAIGITVTLNVTAYEQWLSTIAREGEVNGAAWEANSTFNVPATLNSQFISTAPYGHITDPMIDELNAAIGAATSADEVAAATTDAITYMYEQHFGIDTVADEMVIAMSDTVDYELWIFGGSIPIFASARPSV